MKNKISKTLAILSSIFISIATIGFIILNFHFDPKINKLEVKNKKCLDKQLQSFDLLNKANYYREISELLDDHYNILKLLDSNNKYLLKNQNRLVKMKKNAIVMAINSVINSEQIDSKDSESSIRNIDSLKTDKQLFDKYTYYMKMGAKGNDFLQTKIDNNFKSIEKITKYKNIFWIMCLVFQSTGMLLGVFSIKYKKA